tara:strand:- start:1119 stop:1505 length:387 start_codon:yes stop_codon:yes gene_type:complete
MNKNKINKSIPKDKDLYQKVKKKIYQKIPKHSAYRSGLIVKKYKEEYEKIYKSKKSYIGKKNNKGLARWFKEEWKNQDGEIGYKKKGDIYRPTKKISKDTPKTFKELSKKKIEISQKEKYKNGRVKRF